jgi:hypothetical protein
MDQLPDVYLADVLPLAKKIALAVGHEDYNILQVSRSQMSFIGLFENINLWAQNNGKIAHQHVFHVHFHVIPKPNETEGLGVVWPRIERSKEELARVLEKILAKM